MFLEFLPQILSGIASILALWFTYNQYTKNKITDYKIEKWKQEEHSNNVKQAGNIATIYGELWELLYFLKADRVYLIQPHPLYKEMYISATLEVKQYGVSSVRDSLCDIKIESVASFVSDLANSEYKFIKGIETSELDDKIKSIMTSNGCHSVALRRLSDEKNNWIGTIVIGYIHNFNNDMDIELIEKMSRSSALAIQYILPEFKTK